MPYTNMITQRNVWKKEREGNCVMEEIGVEEQQRVEKSYS
jgi:hypothetical protein